MVHPPDPDLGSARSPAGAFYGPDAYARQRERVFGRAFQLAPLPRAPMAANSIAPWTMLEGLLDEPLLWTADEGARVRCLSNVCTHRGRILAETPAACATVRCPYHGRTFGLDGKLRTAPGFEDAVDFPSPTDDLPEVAAARWRGFHFAALDPAVPFEEWIAPLERIAGHLIDALPAEPTETRAYQFDANWVLYLDNYLEGFHIPFVHRGLAPVLDWSEYGIERFPWGSVQVGIAADGEPGIDLPQGHPWAGRRVAGFWLWLFPNTMWNFYPWGLSINVVEPLGPARTRVRYRIHVAHPELRDRGAGADLERIEREDQREVVAVQRGVRSRLYPGGRYAERHEAAVHHFHGLLRRAMEG